MPDIFTNDRPHVVVLGLMGVGKSTTARAIGEAGAVPVHDSDEDIENLFGQTGSQLADANGIDELHRVESAVLLGRLADEVPSVISAAASVVDDPLARQALANRAHVAVLHAPVDEIMQRIATGAHRRGMDRAELAALAERRSPLFTAVSDIDLDATKSTSELVAAVLR